MLFAHRTRGRIEYKSEHQIQYSNLLFYNSTSALQASCTLDASVKIYSCRVDDTHASSQKIIESLGRTLGVEGREERGAARVGTKSASSKLNIADTIATNVDSINSAKLERVQATDPLFYKMSKAFDEGGAKGMLMTNLVSTSPIVIIVFYPVNIHLSFYRLSLTLTAFHWCLT